MESKISVLIPIYYTERFLANCLESVIKQSLSEIEIICVEDASTDHSRIILEKYATKDSRIHIIWHEKNVGLVKTRKDAVLSAHGKYIMFLDSDDELFPKACEVAYNAIEKSKTDAVQFGVQYIDSQGKLTTTKRIPQTYKNGNSKDDWLELLSKGQITWTIWDKIYNTALCKLAFEQMEDGYMVMADDVYYFFAFGYFATTFSTIEDVLHKYRQRSGVWSEKQEHISLERYKILLSEKRPWMQLFGFMQRGRIHKNMNP